MTATPAEERRTRQIIAQVNRYMRSLRSAAKHDYANHYATYLYAYLPGGHPEYAHEPDRGQLSYMAAQAVRINLRAIIGVTP